MVAALAVVLFARGRALAAPHEDPADLERRVKAAFLYKFAGYVTWPTAADSSAPLRIGVLGDDAMAAELKRIVADHTLDGRPIAVSRLGAAEALESLPVLFVGRGESARLGQILRTLAGRPVLTVTDVDDGLAQGSIINFVVVGGHVRFEISLASAQHARLQLSSRLLAVAQNVVRER